MNEETKSCHLTQAGQTARFRQFGRPVLGGNFFFPHSSGSGLMVFWCHFYPAKRITKPKFSDFFFTLFSLQTHSAMSNFLIFWLLCSKHLQCWATLKNHQKLPKCEKNKEKISQLDTDSQSRKCRIISRGTMFSYTTFCEHFWNSCLMSRIWMSYYHAWLW